MVRRLCRADVCTEKAGSSQPQNTGDAFTLACALFDPTGVAVSLGDHMPVHLGAMPMSVAAALAELGALDPGDVACLNDPFRGGIYYFCRDHRQVEATFFLID